MSKSVTVKAPSSTANLGPGFDVFGLALNAFYDQVKITKKGKGIKIITSDEIPSNPQKNTAGLVAKNMLKKFKIKDGIEIKIKKGVPAVEAGGKEDRNNGNGSLMRILPLVYTYKNLDFPELIQQVHDCSCITHGHVRSQMACGIYISIAICLLQGLEPKAAYLQGIENIKQIYSEEKYAGELNRFQKVLNGEVENIPLIRIHASGYVLDTLEASLWCFLTTNSFAEAVLKAVNLGEDTDTTGAVTGGLAGIYYGIENMPNEWIEVIARKDDIVNLAARLETAILDKNQAKN